MFVKQQEDFVGKKVNNLQEIDALCKIN